MNVFRIVMKEDLAGERDFEIENHNVEIKDGFVFVTEYRTKDDALMIHQQYAEIVVAMYNNDCVASILRIDNETTN